MTFLSVAYFFGVLGLFGAALAIAVLRVRDTFGILAFAFSAGAAFYMVLSNALGYILPIRTSFTLTLLLLLAAALGMVAWGRRSARQAGIRMPFEVPPRRILITVLAVFIAVGLAYARDRGSDEWVPTHFAFPALILEGNFPIREMDFPWERTTYHYGYTLLVAGITHTTGLSLAHAHAFLPPIAAAGILFFAGAIAWNLRRSWGAAALAAILTLGGAGLFWLYTIPLARDLFAAYVEGAAVDPSPFRWLTPAIRSIHAGPLLMMLGHRAIALGGASFFGVLYCLQGALGRSTCRQALPWIITAIVFGAALANTMETTFVPLLAALAAYALAAPLFGARLTKHLVFVAAAFILPSILIAVTQGGPLSEMHGSTGTGAFTWNLSGRIYHDNNIGNDSIAAWDLRFWRDYGFHLVLFLGATAFFWRRRKTAPFALLLVLLALMHFAVPVVLFYGVFPAQLLRFFYVYFSLGSLLIALMLWEAFFAVPSRRIIGSIVVVMLLTASALNTLVRLTFPSLRLQATEVFPSMPRVDAAQSAMHAWVRQNTTLEDYFFVATVWNNQDARTMEKDRLIFAFSAARFAISFGNHSTPAPEITAHIRAMNERCANDAFDALHVRYIVVPTERQAAWFAAECDRARWRPVFTGGEMYPIIYERAEVR